MIKRDVLHRHTVSIQNKDGDMRCGVCVFGGDTLAFHFKVTLFLNQTSGTELMGSIGSRRKVRAILSVCLGVQHIPSAA